MGRVPTNQIQWIWPISRIRSGLYSGSKSLITPDIQYSKDYSADFALAVFLPAAFFLVGAAAASINFTLE